MEVAPADSIFPTFGLPPYSQANLPAGCPKLLAALLDDTKLPPRPRALIRAASATSCASIQEHGHARKRHAPCTSTASLQAEPDCAYVPASPPRRDSSRARALTTAHRGRRHVVVCLTTTLPSMDTRSPRMSGSLDPRSGTTRAPSRRVPRSSSRRSVKLMAIDGLAFLCNTTGLFTSPGPVSSCSADVRHRWSPTANVPTRARRTA